MKGRKLGILINGLILIGFIFIFLEYNGYALQENPWFYHTFIDEGDEFYWSIYYNEEAHKDYTEDLKIDFIPIDRSLQGVKIKIESIESKIIDYVVNESITIYDVNCLQFKGIYSETKDGLNWDESDPDYQYILYDNSEIYSYILVYGIFFVSTNPDLNYDEVLIELEKNIETLNFTVDSEIYSLSTDALFSIPFWPRAPSTWNLYENSAAGWSHYEVHSSNILFGFDMTLDSVDINPVKISCFYGKNGVLKSYSFIHNNNLVFKAELSIKVIQISIFIVLLILEIFLITTIVIEKIKSERGLKTQDYVVKQKENSKIEDIIFKSILFVFILIVAIIFIFNLINLILSPNFQYYYKPHS